MCVTWYHDAKPRTGVSLRSNVACQIKRDTTCIIVVIWVFFFQTELLVEIYSKSLVRAISKILLMNFR